MLLFRLPLPATTMRGKFGSEFDIQTDTDIVASRAKSGTILLATTCIAFAAEYGSFNRVRQVASICSLPVYILFREIGDHHAVSAVRWIIGGSDPWLKERSRHSSHLTSFHLNWTAHFRSALLSRTERCEPAIIRCPQRCRGDRQGWK